MNATQRQSAAILFAATCKRKGIDVGPMLDDAQGGNASASRALAVHAMSIAVALEAQGDARYSVLLELAAEFEAAALRSESSMASKH